MPYDNRDQIIIIFYLETWKFIENKVKYTNEQPKSYFILNIL